ncbi:hypothetical protein [Pseudomonas sp.]|uniref:hypothetical protein n=1 Tax=Pseudomonas sp. TaxID=306 RepID=UPI002620284D|nr:hypothetical protein [Pseudomonas sp.]
MQQLTTTGKLPHGLVITGVTYTGFEMREALLADMIDAELESGGPGNAIHYNAQLAVRQLTRVTNDQGDEFKGPFVVAMVKKRGDFLALRKAQLDLDELGNVEPSASGGTGTPSS